MFTGLVEKVGVVTQVERTERSMVLDVGVDFSDDPPQLGDSVAVNGCCLTVVALGTEAWLRFAVSSETLTCTNLGALQVGAEVNLERSLAVGQRLGGHFVSGHVDCVGVITEVEVVGEFRRVGMRVSHPEARGLVIPKGSICCDGVSLTVNLVATVNEGEGVDIEVMLIPATIDNTIFRTKEIGQLINIEFDMVAKYILARPPPDLF